MPEFYMIHARKINKIPEFYMIFARKVPEFYIIISRKIFFCPKPPPVSYASATTIRQLMLCEMCYCCRFLINQPAYFPEDTPV